VPQKPKELTNKELVRLLANDPCNEAAWREFLNRFHRHICRTLNRECGRIGYSQGDMLIQDLAQEVYQKLVKNNCNALKEHKGSHENSIFKYLEIIALRTAYSNYRKIIAES